MLQRCEISPFVRNSYYILDFKRINSFHEIKKEIFLNFDPEKKWLEF